MTIKRTPTEELEKVLKNSLVVVAVLQAILSICYGLFLLYSKEASVYAILFGVLVIPSFSVIPLYNVRKFHDSGWIKKLRSHDIEGKWDISANVISCFELQPTTTDAIKQSGHIHFEQTYRKTVAKSVSLRSEDNRELTGWDILACDFSDDGRKIFKFYQMLPQEDDTLSSSQSHGKGIEECQVVEWDNKGRPTKMVSTWRDAVEPHVYGSNQKLYIGKTTYTRVT
ncbi:hypothetical protein ACIMS1_005368 [Vibrio harveyi]